MANITTGVNILLGEVDSANLSVRVGKAPGPDEIQSQIIKENAGKN